MDAYFFVFRLITLYKYSPVAWIVRKLIPFENYFGAQKFVNRLTIKKERDVETNHYLISFFFYNQICDLNIGFY